MSDHHEPHTVPVPVRFSVEHDRQGWHVVGASRAEPRVEYVRIRVETARACDGTDVSAQAAERLVELASSYGLV